MGGKDGFGPIPIEENEPVFHADWERRMYGIGRLVLTKRLFLLDEFRHAIERIPPARYLNATYYEKWMMGLYTLLIEKGLATPDEIKGGLPVEPIPTVTLKPTAKASIPRVKARFKKGDAIITRNYISRLHTRMPRYAHGKHGVIHSDEGIFPLPDTWAHGGGPNAQHTYAVRFSARELWGENASPREFVYIDLWEDYLEPARGKSTRRRAGS